MNRSVLIRFSGEGIKWYRTVKKLFYGFLDGRKDGVDTVIEISDGTPKAFWLGCKNAVRFLFWKTLKDFRGSIVALHASAVGKGKKIYVFCGNCDTGKSTAARVLYDKGFYFITDDTLLIDVPQKRILVIPYPIEIRDINKNAEFYLTDIQRRKISLDNKELVFIFLKRKIKTQNDYVRYTSFLSDFDERKMIRLKKFDGVVRVLRKTFNIRSIDAKKYISIISKAKFYELDFRM